MHLNRDRHGAKITFGITFEISTSIHNDGCRVPKIISGNQDQIHTFTKNVYGSRCKGKISDNNLILLFFFTDNNPGQILKAF